MHSIFTAKQITAFQSAFQVLFDVRYTCLVTCRGVVDCLVTQVCCYVARVTICILWYSCITQGQRLVYTKLALCLHMQVLTTNLILQVRNVCNDTHIIYELQYGLYGVECKLQAVFTYLY